MSLIHPTLRRRYLAVVFLFIWSVEPIMAGTHALCDAAARTASAETQVPLSVLRAITRTETGRTIDGVFVPWPWTVNMEGVGTWFDREDEARAFVFERFKNGARSFDVGCFQINYKWHGQAFASIEDMFDPDKNARYAADFLATLHAELGSWPAAAGAYHSRTEKYADIYVARFNEIRADLGAQPVTAVAAHTGRVKTNGFPLLLQNGQAARLGSLVPLENAGGDDPLALLQRGG